MQQFFKTDIKKQASSSFLIPASLPPPLLINIDRRGGFWSMPTSRKLDMGCRRSGWWGCPTLFFRTDNKSQASSSFLTSRSPPPPIPVNIDRRGGFRSMPTSRKTDMGRRRSGRWGRSKLSMKNRPGKPGRQRRMTVECHFS